MCDCEQIQGLQPEFEVSTFIKYKESGNWYFDGEEVFCVGDVNLSDGLNDEFTSDRQPRVWLPRQDQLQGMLGETHSVRPISLVGFLHQVLNEDLTCTEEVPCNGCVEEAKYWRSFGSMEKLWLAFVMKEKFNKAWDGKWL